MSSLVVADVMDEIIQKVSTNIDSQVKSDIRILNILTESFNNKISQIWHFNKRLRKCLEDLKADMDE